MNRIYKKRLSLLSFGAALCAVLATGVIGLRTIHPSAAASYSVAIEPEQGVLSNGARNGMDSQASKGSYVQFGQDDSRPHTLLFTPKYQRFDNWFDYRNLGIVQAQIDRLAKMKFNGFNYFHQSNGLWDGFKASAITDPHYATVVNEVQSLKQYSQSRGVTDMFVWFLSSGIGDVYDTANFERMKTSCAGQAQFVKDTGMTGVWLDLETYGAPNDWTQGSDAAAITRYEQWGEACMNAMLTVQPSIEVLTLPWLSFGLQDYARLADFYAGMTAAAMKKGALPPVLATESTYTASTVHEVHSNYCTEIGICTDIPPGPVKAAMQAYDSRHGTKLWEWHAANYSIAISNWPWTNEGQRISPDQFKTVMTEGRKISNRYTWIYDDDGYWTQNSYSCAWKGQTITSDIPCPGLIMQEMLPPLAR